MILAVDWRIVANDRPVDPTQNYRPRLSTLNFSQRVGRAWGTHTLGSTPPAKESRDFSTSNATNLERFVLCLFYVSKEELLILRASCKVLLKEQLFIRRFYVILTSNE